MFMVLKVVPTAAGASFRRSIRETIQIMTSIESSEDLVTALQREGVLDEIVQFVARCRHRVRDLMGETVLLVDFREDEPLDPNEPSPIAHAPSLN